MEPRPPYPAGGLLRRRGSVVLRRQVEEARGGRPGPQRHAVRLAQALGLCRPIRRYRTQRNQFPQWQAECYEKSLGRNGDFARPLDSRECYHVAKSVAKWTWRKDAEAQARFLARQAARGRKGGLASGVVRLAAGQDLRASARLMHAQDPTMGNSEIARRLGVPRPTVIRWLREGGEED